MKLNYLLLAAFLLPLAGCWKDLPFPLDPKEPKAPSQINFTEPNLFPEGVVYDPFNKRFYVSSTTRGDIGIVTGQGTYTPFITDEALTSTTGLEVDKARKRLLVCNSPGQLGAYDINTGTRIFFANLAALLPGAPIFVNDAALDNEGNAYVTNSLSPVIYKVDRNGNASVFFQNAAFALPPGSFGFNGIEYDNRGFLLVNFTARNQVIKIPVSNTAGYSIVQLDAALDRPDGLLLSKDGKQLIVVNNAGGGEGKVLSFISNDKWESGHLNSSFTTGAVFPTSATSDGKNVYVLYAYLHRRTVGQATYTIQQVPLKDARPF
ncbi:MAG: hypothetical protein ICV65_00510 [Flavisolibacter sp.]|nr:hypothetical protein [Flavisolibacter sp.]